MSERIFDNYDEAIKHSFNTPWKLSLCNTGESCWCRIILPVETIKYKNISSSTGKETIEEIEWIIPDGSIDKETAEYFLELHHASLNNKKAILDNMENIRKTSCDKELGGLQ